MTLDIRDIARAKTDQLNADDLKGRTLVAVITSARAGNAEQPLVLHLDSWAQPWKPCKSMMRLLGDIWQQPDAEQWVGRLVELYRDPSVRFGKDAVGGIRVRAASHIDSTVTVMLPISRGKRGRFTVEPLMMKAPTPLADICDGAGITLDALATWHQQQWGNPLPAEGSDNAVQLARHIASNRDIINDIKRAADAVLGDERDGGEE